MEVSFSCCENGQRLNCLLWFSYSLFCTQQTWYVSIKIFGKSFSDTHVALEWRRDYKNGLKNHFMLNLFEHKEYSSVLYFSRGNLSSRRKLTGHNYGISYSYRKENLVLLSNGAYQGKSQVIGHKFASKTVKSAPDVTALFWNNIRVCPLKGASTSVTNIMHCIQWISL